MKIVGLLPLLAVADQKAIDDDSALLAVGNSRAALQQQEVSTSLMAAASSRNVKQMAELIEELVKDSTEGDGINALDDDIRAALNVIQDSLTQGIRHTLMAEHKLDQEMIMESLACFDQCRGERHHAEDNCEKQEVTITTLRQDHIRCRSNVKAGYELKVKECNVLDDWVRGFELTPKVHESCVYDAAYMCHLDDENPPTPDIDGKFGAWLKKVLQEAKQGHITWLHLHNKCKAAYHAYIEVDASCDVVQERFQQTVWDFAQCQHVACEVEFTRCRADCMARYHREVKRVECAERDRKVDWSSIEKIECYILILLASPTSERLNEVCDDGNNCLNKWRTQEYDKCKAVCPEIDYESGDYSQHTRRNAVEGESLDSETEYSSSEQGQRQLGDNTVKMDRTWGVNTTHRGEGENRCTQHLDIDFQPIPCTQPCPDPELPCTDEWEKREYKQFDSKTDIAKLSAARKCHRGEHQEWYAYNRCECTERHKHELVGEPGLTDDIYCETDYQPPLYYVGYRTFHMMDFEHESLLWNDRGYTLKCADEMLGASYWLQPHKSMDRGLVRISRVPLGARVYIAVEDTIQNWRSCDTRPCSRDGNIVFDDTWHDLGEECAWVGYRGREWSFGVWTKIVNTEEDITFSLTENWVGFAAWKMAGNR